MKLNTSIIMNRFFTSIAIISGLVISSSTFGHGYYSSMLEVDSQSDSIAFGFDNRGLYSLQDETKDFLVFTMTDLSANQIKASLYSKLSTMYKSPKDVITNVADNILQLDGYASSVYYKKTTSDIYPVDFSFSMIIQIKDGKIRYNIPTIQQIYMQNVPFLGTARLDMTKSLAELVRDNAEREAVTSYFNNLIRVLNSSICAEEDW